MTAYQSPDAFTVPNGPGATVRAAFNVDIQAAAMLSQGTSAPASPYPGQPWHDLTTNTLKIRNQANSAWIIVGKFDETAGVFVPMGDGTEQSIASAATTDLGSVAEQAILITGTTGITSFGSSASVASPIYFLRFNNTLTLTHNATSLILPGAANIKTASGDCAIAKYEGSGNWRVISYTPCGTTWLTNSLGADVNLNNTGTFFDGPSVAQGAVGTWLVTGNVILNDTAGAANFNLKLWDGTTIIDSGAASVPGASATGTISLSGIITNPAGNLRISAQDGSSISGHIKFNASGNGKDSTITAVRIG